MQHYSLTVDKMLDHAAKWCGDREVVEADAGKVVNRVSYADLRTRSNLLSGALAQLGLRQGDRIGTVAWNTLHHFEIYFAIMGAGLSVIALVPAILVTMFDIGSDGFRHAAFIMAAIAGALNLLNLLPFMPLDGGHFFGHVLFNRNRWLTLGTIGVGLAGMGSGLFLSEPMLLVGPNSLSFGARL